MIDLIAAAGIGGIIGYRLFASKLGKAEAAAKTAEEHRDWWVKQYDRAIQQRDHRTTKGLEALDAHTRCADALTTAQRKLSAIRDLLDKPRTIRKGELASILDGDA